MIPPRLQWAHQIVVTSLCWPKASDGTLSACSNCTRLLGHEKRRYVMTPDQFEQCVKVAKDFVYQSPPCPQGRRNKVLGIFGGEPLLSPYFGDYVDILCKYIREPKHRGLWTSIDWTKHIGKYGAAKPLVERLLNVLVGKDDILHTVYDSSGYLNWNMHSEEQHCEHHPVLLAIDDMIPDVKKRWELISECWLNRDWSAAYALDSGNEPKFYFCEVASSFDRVMKLGTGLPVVNGIWNYDLRFVPNNDGVLVPHGVYAKQILNTCGRCGQALPLKAGRRDLDNKDDISVSNLSMLQDSPMVKRGDYFPANADSYVTPRHPHDPGQYIKDGYHQGNKVNER